ncbi:bifunctional diaminohydroxyphosphoribosylaminopyrimidine deaminase/5-amino-6-(5-phosphoribosylamino)uracil reductase RibD [bacterium]|nr:bifunctional diaminohydroxyphosphoribosylaminopyrimidine deaminase/5-amino-6-(5-phosphoribosylamino)uracil reductase RibD [bacterium]
MNSYVKKDELYMRIAIGLGARGKGSTFPNPPVGAILVKDSRIIGKGWHRYRGEPHAEINAIEDARSNKNNTEGATLYVTLEPCCHYGTTPPCTEAILKAGITRVVVSCRDDFDERVCGMGIAILREEGISVDEGVLADEGMELIDHYRVQRTERRAFLTLKWAQSIDGMIATATGHSQWISGAKALKFGHILRTHHGSVAVGANTVTMDNPHLNIRSVESHHKPARIILVGGRELASSLNVFSNDSTRVLVIRDGEYVGDEILPEFVETLFVPRGKFFWKNLLTSLYERGVGSVLLEGGGKVITSALKAKAADKIFIAIAPIFIGAGISAIGDIGTKDLNEALKLGKVKYRNLDDDIIISGYSKRD